MQYGRIMYNMQGDGKKPVTCNIGDFAQIMAIDLIYTRMGIDPKTVKEIPVEQLQTYAGGGEQILTPVNGYFRYNREYPAFPTSKAILPVFISIHTGASYLNKKAFWQTHGPIGCRDEATANAMRKRGCEAYLLGCSTMLFPRREKTPAVPKVFLADVHPGVEAYIPAELRPYVEHVSHEIAVEPAPDPMQTGHKCREKAEAIYRRYAEEATLVVTSRLHCAAPCIAMGIPTIVVKNNFDKRFGWLDRFVHLYTPDEYKSINWAPEPIDCEEFKSLLMQAVISMIKRQPDRALLEQIDTFFMQRERKKLRTPLLAGGYMFLYQYCPKTAFFLRNKVLRRFSISAYGSGSDDR